MLITALKSIEEFRAIADMKTVIVSCEGCKEVYFPEIEAKLLYGELTAMSPDIKVIYLDYVCNPENLAVQTSSHLESIGLANKMLVFSCGVGVQSVCEMFPSTHVFAGCDTLALPGAQGVTPLEVDCAGCGQCYLNYTGGICPIALCSKSLINGQCGGCKDGKCEVDHEMDCAWALIYSRLEELELLHNLNYEAKLRNYAPSP